MSFNIGGEKKLKKKVGMSGLVKKKKKQECKLNRKFCEKYLKKVHKPLESNTGLFKKKGNKNYFFLFLIK